MQHVQPEVAPEVYEVEALAAAAGVAMPIVLSQAGVALTTYWRWKNARVDPQTKTIRKLKAVIAELGAA